MQIWKSIDRHLPELLSRAALVLTHGATTQPRGYSFEDFVEKRQRQLLSALQKYGSKDTPVAVVEHGSRSTQARCLILQHVYVPDCCRCLKVHLHQYDRHMYPQVARCKCVCVKRCNSTDARRCNVPYQAATSAEKW